MLHNKDFDGVYNEIQEIKYQSDCRIDTDKLVNMVEIFEYTEDVKSMEDSINTWLIDASLFIAGFNVKEIIELKRKGVMIHYEMLIRSEQS